MSIVTVLNCLQFLTAYTSFDFLSPRWSPDLAGWNMLATAASALSFIVLFLADRWLRLNTK